MESICTIEPKNAREGLRIYLPIDFSDQYMAALKF